MSAPEAASKLGRWRGVRAYPITAAICVIVVLYLVGTVGRAYQKLFWHDEILTVTVVALPVHDYWSALLDGTDLTPPLFHLATAISHRLWGEGHIATRMPAVVGFLFATLGVGLFVGRRCGGLAGLVAMLLLLGSDAYPYAYEARPYGLVLGFAAGALVCWQTAVNTPSRMGWLIGLWACLTAAISSHYYATLLLVPFAFAELSRLISTRRSDWALWSALVFSLAPLVAFWPLIQAVRSFSAGYFSPATVGELFSSYESTVAALIVPLVVALGLIGVAMAFVNGYEKHHAPVRAIATHEWLVAIGLLALPVIGFVPALLAGAFVPRYFIAWTLGFSILVPFVAAQLPRKRIVLFALATVLFVFVGARQASSARLLLQPRPTLALAYASLLHNDQSLPVLVPHSHVFVAASHYAPQLASRIVYPLRPDRLAIRGDTSPRILRALSRWEEIHAEDFDQFIREQPRFLVYGPTPNWVVNELQRKGARLVLRAIDVDETRFAVSRPGPCTLFEVSLDHDPPKQVAADALPAIAATKTAR